MKRSGPLPRRTPLARSAMPPRRTPLTRSTARLRLRRPVLPAERATERKARQDVAARSRGLCEVCPELHQGSDWHHRVRKSQGGPWSASNGLWLCRRVHDWVTGNPHGARVKGWGLESHEDPATEPVLYRGEWVVLGDDGAVTPTHIPERAAELLRVATREEKAHG